MRQKAQISIEYLIILVAFISIFSFLLPLFTDIYSTGLFYADCRNAESFVNLLKTKTSTLSILSAGSVFSVEAEPINVWRLYSYNGTSFLEVIHSSELKKKIQFELAIPVKNIDLLIEKKFVLILERNSDFLLIKNSNFP